MITSIKSKTTDPAPGSLISARIEFGKNGGCSVYLSKVPEKKKANNPSLYEPDRPEMYASVEEACHAIVQAAGGDSEYSESDTASQEAAEGE
jgi:hypothetical protein